MTNPVDPAMLDRLLRDHAARAAEAPVPASPELILLKARLRREELRETRGRRVETWAFAAAGAALAACIPLAGAGGGLLGALALVASAAAVTEALRA